MRAKARTRKDAIALVESAIGRRYETWYDRLNGQDKRYILDVVAAMKATPGVVIHSVAGALIRELNLSVKHWTVSKTLREMLSNA